jgi:hypothetical protein
MSVDPKEVFRKPIQIGLLVDDLETVIQNLETIFGIGPFRVVNFPPPGFENVMRKYKGEDANFSAKFCFFDLGNIELEIIQPLSGESIWRDFIDKHGPGLHHIKFSIPEHAPVREYLEGQGITIEQMGASVGKNAGKEWVFYDTYDKIGFGIELMNEIIKKP